MTGTKRSAAVLVAFSCCALAQALPPENDRWDERRSDHFIFYGNADDKAMRALALQFETLYAAFAAIVPGVEMQPRAIAVYVFRDLNALRPYAAVRAGLDPAHPTGYYRWAEHVELCVVAATDDPFAIEFILRAYLADLVRSTYPGAPPWVVEGLSQICSRLTSSGEYIEVGRAIVPHVKLLRSTSPIPFRELFAMPRPDEESEIIGGPSVFGAESWALVHYLLIGNEALRPQTVRFLQALSRGTAARAAFDGTLGAAAGDLDAALGAYVALPTMEYLKIPVSAVRIRPLGDPAPLARRDVLHRLGWLLANIDVSNAAAADAHFRAALAIDPAHGPSLAGLGWLRSRAKEFDDAAGLFDEALSSGTNDPLTLTLAARNLLAQYGATRSTFDAPQTLPEGVARARALLMRATAADPRFGEAHVALGATYLYDPADVAPGIAEIETALTLDPPRADPLVNLVALYARAGDRAKAQALVDGPIAALGDPAVVLSARESLAFADLTAINAKIAAGDLDGALEILRIARDAAPTPRLQAQFESEIARIEPVAAKNRHIARFNDAVSLANQGDWRGAAALCDALLAESLDDELRPRVQDLRDRADSSRHGSEED